jgi:5-methylphenazine-1-carboxylate 1-monooxygenase
VCAKLGDGAELPQREDWSRIGRLVDHLPHIEGVFHLPEVDPTYIIRATQEFYEYPMCDRDPLPRWSFGRVALLGDATHPIHRVVQVLGLTKNCGSGANVVFFLVCAYLNREVTH